MDLSRVEQREQERQLQRTYLVMLYVSIAIVAVLVASLTYLIWRWVMAGMPQKLYVLGGAGTLVVCAAGTLAVRSLRTSRFTLPKFQRPKSKLPTVKLSLHAPYRSKATYVGLDIGTSSIKLVQVAKTKHGPRIVQYGILSTPANAVENGVVKNKEVVIEAVRQLYRERKVRQDRVITVLTGQNLIIRHVEFPKMPESELREALKWEAEQYIPIPKDDSVVDFQVVPQSDDQPTDKMQVMLVATYRRPIQDYIDIVKAAKLKPHAIDIEPLAVLRALQVGQVRTAGGVIVIDMGAGTTNMSIFAQGILQSTRIIPIAGNDFTESIAQGLGVSMAEADSRKKLGGLHVPEIQAYLSVPAERLMQEIGRTVEFYLFKNRDRALSKVYLVGGGAYLGGLKELLEGMLNQIMDKLGVATRITIEIGHPAQHMEVDTRIQQEVDQVDAILVTALGLALREVVS